MTREELIDRLRDVESDLRSQDFRRWLHSLPEAERARLVRARADLSLAITRLETARLTEIAQRLDTHADDLKTAADDLEREAERLQDAQRVLDALDKTAGLAARILAFLG